MGAAARGGDRSRYPCRRRHGRGHARCALDRSERPVTNDTGDEMTTTTSTLTDMLTGLPTATVSDALDKLGLRGQLDGLATITHLGAAVCGPAFTVAYGPVGAEHGTVGDFLDDVPPGAVIVIDNRARTDCTVWGGIMTRVAHPLGAAATVIHGG